MLADLNELLDKHRRGEDTPEADFDEFMAKHGQYFPENPRNVDELIDALAQRAAAAQRMLNSMTPEQREELLQLSAQAFGSPELMAQLGQLDTNLQALRPGEDWSGSENVSTWRGGPRAGRRHRRAAGPRRTGLAGRPSSARATAAREWRTSIWRRWAASWETKAAVSARALAELERAHAGRRLPQPRQRTAA